MKRLAGAGLLTPLEAQQPGPAPNTEQAIRGAERLRGLEFTAKRSVQQTLDRESFFQKLEDLRAACGRGLPWA